jgi:chromosomal replication initiator protein
MSEEEQKLQNMIAQHRTAEDIISIVKAYTGTEILQKTRKREVSDARQIAMYLIKENTSLSYRQTACACGLQSHASAWHACRQVKLHMSIDRAFKEKYGDLIDFT